MSVYTHTHSRNAGKPHEQPGTHVNQHPEDLHLLHWGLARAQAWLTSSTPTHPKAGEGWGVDSVPGNNRPITPSGQSREKDLREKELREGNSSPSGRGHRPLVASPVGVSGPSLCSRPRPHTTSHPHICSLHHLDWLPHAFLQRRASELGSPDPLSAASQEPRACSHLPLSWLRAASMSTDQQE